MKDLEFHRGDRVWVLGGHRKDRIGQWGIVKHVDSRRLGGGGKLLLWVYFGGATQAVCYNAKDLTNKAPLEWLAEQAD